MASAKRARVEAAQATELNLARLRDSLATGRFVHPTEAGARLLF